MPSSNERRLIKWFATCYNTCNDPKITKVFAEDYQEAPDAICVLENSSFVGLELTSVGAPKGTHDRGTPHRHPNLKPLVSTMEKKLRNDYRNGMIDEVWLLIHLRLTLPASLVEDAIKNILVPPRFDRVYLQWPLPGKFERININVLELPNHQLWMPDLPRPVCGKITI